MAGVSKEGGGVGKFEIELIHLFSDPPHFAVACVQT